MRNFQIAFVLLISILSLGFIGEDNEQALKVDSVKIPEFLKEEGPWIDSVLNSFTLEEKIGQLIMYPVYTRGGEKELKKIEGLIENHNIGGVIYMQGGPVRQVKAHNRLMAKAKTPLLTSIDGEWGVRMRLDSVIRFPRQMLLGAIQNDSLIYDMGVEIAKQCSLTGVHINFAPVVDINVNSNNPVINSRSFGELKEQVAKKSLAYMDGMQDNKVIACAKHFPGHGDTDKDSHLALPTIKHSAERIDSVELYPFKALVDSGVGSIMVAHLYIPSLDATKNRASTLSPKIVQGLLKDSLKFKGLAITDALNMHGVSKYYKTGEVDLMALLAGNDILLFSQDVGKAVDYISKAVKKGTISEAEITARCKKVIQMKKWLGLDQFKPLSADSLIEKLNSPEASLINRRLVENAITLLENDSNILPIKGLAKLNLASVSIGSSSETVFQKTLSNYAAITHYQIPKSPSQDQVSALIDSLSKHNLVIIGVHGTNRSPRKKFGITKGTVELIKNLNAAHPVVLSLFSNPYSLESFSSITDLEGLIMGYEDTPLSQEYSAQLIFGGIAAKGKLPVTGSNSYPSGAGLSTTKTRFKYSIPIDEGFNNNKLDLVDSIALQGIENKAYPGCQILIARRGNVIYNKAFGHHTYEEKKKVKTTDLYDLASITKVSASVPNLMNLCQQDSIGLDYNLCDYLGYVDSTEYINMNLRRMLAHNAGLVSWIPFYKKTMAKGQLKYDIYSSAQSEVYPNKVAEGLYIKKEYSDSIRSWITTHGIHKKQDYRYSDLGYYFYKDIIEKYSNTTLDKVSDSLFYKPLGATTLTYKPLEKFSKDRIVPTENDMLYRRGLVHGTVHDPGAAMLGGVAGHAGLFSNANDLAKLFQMYLNNGEYGGERYLDSNVVSEFTKVQFKEEDNRRGAGFDKPSTTEYGPTCSCVSYDSFGHSGFTGTLVWADPDKEIVYVFLSNRVYPDADNKKLIRMNIRTDIMQVIYDSIHEELQ